MDKRRGMKLFRIRGYDHAPVNLSDDAWLGTHVVVLPGVNDWAGVVLWGAM